MSEQRIYKIPGANMDVLIKTVNKLNHRAKFLHLPEIALVIEHSEFEQDAEHDEIVRLYHYVTLSAPTVKLNGWHLVARVQWLEGDPVFFTAPNETLQGIRVAKPYCEHCNSVRNRNDTYLVRNELGTAKQVGSNCLRDFLGHNDAAQLAEFLELYVRAVAEADSLEHDPELDYRGSGLPIWHYMKLDMYMPYVAMTIRMHGWVSRTKAKEELREATADAALHYMFPLPGATERHEPTDADTALADKAVKWASLLYGQPDQVEYIQNIATIAHAGVLTNKMIGYAASIIVAYQRTLNTPIIPKPSKPVSHWLSAIGEKLELAVKVTYTTVIPGYGMGSTVVVKMEDDDGNRLVWFASNPPDSVAVGNVLTLRGTVKAHNTYHEQQETQLTRCKVLSFVLAEGNIDGKDQGSDH